MNIVLVIDQYDNRNNGTTVTARNCAEQLRLRGHNVKILAGGKDEENKVAVKKLKIPIFQPLIEKQGFCFAKPSDEAYYQAFSNADIIHFYLPSWFCRRGEELARQMKIPTVAAFHLQPENVTYSLGMGRFKRINDALYRYFYRNFYNRFRFIHCPSQMIADQLKEHGYDAECRVISNGVSANFKPKTIPKPNEFKDKFVILSVGRLSGEKRQDLLIKAVQLSKYRDKIQLIFAGSGPKEKKYRALAKNLPNTPIFKFYSQDELIKIMNMSDLYVHASDAEIEGISCMEAMACGLVPVISDSKLSATKNFAPVSECLFNAGDAISLANRIDYWIEHPEKRRAISKVCAEKAENIRVDKCIDEVEKLYQDVIKDYYKNGYKNPKETTFRRFLHPKPEKVNKSYETLTPFNRVLRNSFTNFLAIIIYVIDTTFFGFKVNNRHLLKQIKGGAITVMNHVHPMDCTMVKLAVFPRRIFYTSLRRNLELPFIGWLIKACGALPLPTEFRQIAQFQKSLKHGIRSHGDWVHYYPEGMLVRYHEKLRKFNPGAFYTAVDCGCPIIPMVITYQYPKGIWRIAAGRRRLILTIGEPQYPNTNLSHKEAVLDLSERTYSIMTEMIENPLPAKSLDPFLATRIVCIFFIMVQIFRFLGVV